MKNLLLHAWSRRGWLACLLWPVSRLYGLAVYGKTWLYQAGILHSARFHLPVIVVGNVVTGGAGKTPLVIAIVHHLQSKGLRVGIVSRGYGRRSQTNTEVTPDTPLGASGDEPALIRQATGAPVFVAVRRAEAVASLLASYPATDIVVSDDGLQHLAMGRDINIAVFDDRGVGNGWLLPAGPLREPWPAQPSRQIDLVLHTGQRPAFAGFTSSRALMSHGVAANGVITPLAELAGTPLLALAAIARPDSFFDMLLQQGLVLDATVALPDHHTLDTPDVARLLQAHPTHTLLCTEKDAVKLFRLPAAAQARVLAVPLAFTPEPEFFRALDRLLARPPITAVSHLPS